MTRLTETILSTESRKPDREAGVIPGVRILGRVSTNGRRYSDRAMEQARELYDGRKVNIDHSLSERKFAEGFGEFRSVIVEGHGDDRCVRGDLHYLKSHPQAELVCESAERFPNQFGVSHDAEGEVSGAKPNVVVESLKTVYSIDIVGKPATNKGLYESHQNDPGGERIVEKKSITAILMEASKSEAARRSPAYRILRGLALMEIDGEVEAPVDVAATEVAVEPEMKPEEQIMSGLLAAINEKLKTADEATLKKVMKALGIGDPLKAATGEPQGDAGMGGGDGGGESEGSGESPPEEKSTESAATIRLKTQLAESQRREKAAAALGEAGVPSTAARIRAIAACDNQAERDELIESFKGSRSQGSSYGGDADFWKPARSPAKVDFGDDGNKSYDKVKESVGGSRLF